MHQTTKYIGWTVEDWKQFHAKSTSSESFQLLSELLSSQNSAPVDPAWISLATSENLSHQWKFLQSKSNKNELPLYGVPIAIKDNINVKGFETTAACPSFAFSPEEDATVVKLLRDSGAIIIGKTNLDQFATGLVGTRSPYGITPNTFDPKYVSGGSSAGSASVVARGIVPLSLGTDTAGSGRVPAALNNIIGLKPTKGVFSCAGVIPACKSLDCVSVFALNLPDAQLAFNILAKEDGDNDEYSRSFPESPLIKFPSTPKIAVPTGLLWYGETENPKLFSKAVDIFQNKVGADLISLNIEPLLELAKCLYDGAWVSERFVATKDFLATNPTHLDPTVAEIIKGGEKYSAATAFEFEYKRQGILQKVKKLLKDVDVIIVPTAPLNPTIEQIANEPIKINSYQGTYTNFVNLADMSALAIPASFRPDGLPFGITLLSHKFNDYALLELASRYMKANGPRFYGCLKNQIVSPECDEISDYIPIIPESVVKLAVVGAHLKGFQLHWQLESVGARFIESTTTTANYKLYCLPKTGPIAKPGLRRVDVENGSNIVVEVYSISKEKFGKFISYVPEPLGIGSVELQSGEWVKSFICEEYGYTLPGTVDITEHQGWANYQTWLNNKVQKPFNSVLVANRGEIAVRIIKTLKKLGIKSIAVYSDPDKYSQHSLIADVAIPLHGTSTGETYISIDKIIKAAKESGAEAIIPGYGFLSENAEFSDRCGKEGIVFVGPSGDAMKQLGLKHSARKIAMKAGVPLVPGSDGLVEDANEAKRIAKQLEYPVMVKSTAGGGGVGLQKVDCEDDIERVFATVQHQGKSYFGDSGVFLERFVENARHVEVQMLGDGKGNAIAVGDRDCSLQRRNQKIIEETPAPNLPEATRIKMRQAAESLASTMNYKCAGTVEFIYDEVRDEFYFLEVNARLQVEHPITEMVTGIDLVEWMLLIAADVPPDFNQPIEINGASMEARLYAENPVKDFMPSPGQLTEVKFPEWARVDTWVEKGTVISAEYDPTLAKIIVHGKDRNDALKKLRQALDETVVFGVVTNIDYLRSIAGSEMFEQAQVHTKVLDSYDYKPHAIEVINPGAYTTIQDFPGRRGYWNIGVPPSGCMDQYSFRIANRIVGNHHAAPGIEITLSGPTLVFHQETVIAITGGQAQDVSVNGISVNQWEPISIKSGDKLTIGKLTSGCRAYLSIRGGIEVTEYLGSRSTFALGNLGGYNGRVLKFGDVLFLGNSNGTTSLPAPISEPTTVPKSLIPNYSNKVWQVGVTCGPHGSPDFFKPESVDEFFSSTWKVHYNSNRFGVRLIGPKPKWARPDGGEAGLHPSNTHDYVYSMGAINFTGDEPVILTCDGPSLGGFVCEAVVTESELWKIGQVKPGEFIQFVPVSYATAKQMKLNQDKCIETLQGQLPTFEGNVLTTPENPVLHQFKLSNKGPKITYRQAGDRYILVEYGDNSLDLKLSYRIHKLVEMVKQFKTVGIFEMSPGVRSVLVEFTDEITQAQLLETLISYEQEILFVDDYEVKSRVIRLPMAFEDKKTLDAVTRYQETIRSEAPWLPNNVDFIAAINGITRQDVKSMLYSARFLVLGLGDVFLGAPCAVPLDPRQRFLGTKYNPSRTYTPNGTVGIGGNYMCIYTMESPGGYQLVGRTVPIWDKLSLGQHSDEDKPWLLSIFDQVEFYPVSEEQIDEFTEEMNAGKFKVDIVDTVFNHGEYLEWVKEHSQSIEEFQKQQGGEKLEEFNRLIQVSNSELEKTDSKIEVVEKFDESSEMIYSEYSGRFWKALVEIGVEVVANQALIVVEAMKTEMVVNAPRAGKVVKIYPRNGDMVEAGDLVVVIA
ncbi:hypothetical protein JA1_001872 [Spathaspora sp. JA1]|nr:hypothetical protein JA1_001872 [Spathaspora sp. JA1]